MAVTRKEYFGSTEKSIRTEDFNLSLTIHPANSKIEKHAHAKPYLCLLTSGTYKEESYNSSIIKNGSAIYRTANYEHSNHFSDEQGVCLNLEIDNPERFMLQNDYTLPQFELEQRGSIDIYKLLFAFKNNVEQDLLNIHCYESIFSHFDTVHHKGKLDWIKKIKEFINDDPFASISMNTLSNDLQLHPNYIVRKFKEVTGYKLSEYLAKIRVELSIQGLLQTEKKIIEIALDGGFYDQSHFNRNFKKFLAVTPNQFRNSLKG